MVTFPILFLTQMAGTQQHKLQIDRLNSNDRTGKLFIIKLSVYNLKFVQDRIGDTREQQQQQKMVFHIRKKQTMNQWLWF